MLKALISDYDEYKTLALVIQQVAKEGIDKYGILYVKYIEDRVYKVKGMLEKPDIDKVS